MAQARRPDFPGGGVNGAVASQLCCYGTDAGFLIEKYAPR